MILSIVSAIMSVPLFALSLLSAVVNGMAANHFRLPVCSPLSLFSLRLCVSVFHSISPQSFVCLCWPHAKRPDVLNFDRVCLSVCVSVLYDNFRTPWRRQFIFAHPVHLQGIRVKFAYEGHWVKVKVKVTGAKLVLKNPYCRNVRGSFDI